MGKLAYDAVALLLFALSVLFAFVVLSEVF